MASSILPPHLSQHQLFTIPHPAKGKIEPVNLSSVDSSPYRHSLQMGFPHVKIHELYLDDLVPFADESVEQAVDVGRIGFRKVWTVEDSLLFTVCGGVGEAVAS